jgi:hypothetical protein
MKERHCIDPDAIQDWELVAYADGEELERVSEHVGRCPACRARLREYATIEQELQQLLFGSDCPSPDTLRDHHLGYLSTEERQHVEAHLETCPHCAAELADLAQFAALEEEVRSSTLLDRAHQVAEQVRLTVAQLMSPAPLPLPALRGETREVLLFEADGVALSLNLEQETTGRYTLFGQILSSDPIGFTEGQIRLRAQEGDMEPIQADIDTNGGFALPELRPGIYQLSVDLPDRRIVVPTLALKSEP